MYRALLSLDPDCTADTSLEFGNSLGAGPMVFCTDNAKQERVCCSDLRDLFCSATCCLICSLIQLLSLQLPSGLKRKPPNEIQKNLGNYCCSYLLFISNCCNYLSTKTSHAYYKSSFVCTICVLALQGEKSDSYREEKAQNEQQGYISKQLEKFGAM